MTRTPKAMVAAVCVMAALSLGVAHADRHIADSADVPLITGKHWTAAEEKSKLAFLAGVANTVEIEQALQVAEPPGDNESLVPVIVRGLSGVPLREVMKRLDAWYAEHPDQADRAVIETIWSELAFPNI